MKWAIYGKDIQVIRGFTPNERIVATFDSKEGAEQYVLEARIKDEPTNQNYYGHTLLRNCESASVKEFPQANFPPHNPEINW